MKLSQNHNPGIWKLFDRFLQSEKENLGKLNEMNRGE